MDTQLCITNPEWERYSAKTLSEPLLQHLLEHVQGCAICADIKDGIDLMLDAQKLGERVQSINNEVEIFLQETAQKKTNFWYWSAAALIIFSVGLSWILLKKATPRSENVTNTTLAPALPEQQEIAQLKTDTRTSDIIRPEREQANRSNPAQERTPATEGASTPDSYSTTEDTKQLAENSVPSSVTTASGAAAASPLDSATPSVVAQNNVLMDDYKDQAMLAKSESIANSDDAREERKTKNEVQVARTASKKLKVRTPSETYPSANNGVNARNNTEAENSKVPLVDLNAVDSADYAIAVRNFDSTFYDKCLVNLYYISLNSNSAYFEKALYLRAKVLLKQGKNEDAKVALKTIIDLNRIYRKEASALLDTLK
ncbi:MAG: hypothetical protein NTW54_10715 [Bacteroidetes bacterium]|nr:hypothetical protein [Bacteroidota bacterium]